MSFAHASGLTRWIRETIRRGTGRRHPPYRSPAMLGMLSQIEQDTPQRAVTLYMPR